ncbi:YopX family protein [Candidatus Merdisoma sp. JLR.KK006]|uniref:YopX family protein n=1 Tax=Candidatus Merdisoma sp. JLR.KK006 TaxID=3112626 RepID=UPI002FF1B3F3
MEREILFRAKHIHAIPELKHFDGRWVYGYLSDKNYINSPELEGEFLIDPKTVCQYTGLTDKGGRKIFEGDICKDGDNIVRIFWSDKHQWSVEISKTEYALSRGLTFPLWQYDNCEKNGYRTLEIIGNIFDNPELLREHRLPNI